MKNSKTDDSLGIREAFFNAAETPIVEIACYILGGLLCAVGGIAIISGILAGVWHSFSTWWLSVTSGLICIRAGYTGRRRRQNRLAGRPLLWGTGSAKAIDADTGGPCFECAKSVLSRCTACDKYACEDHLKTRHPFYSDRSLYCSKCIWQKEMSAALVYGSMYVALAVFLVQLCAAVLSKRI